MRNIDFIQFNCNGIRGYDQNPLLIKNHATSYVVLLELKLKKADKCSFPGYHFLRKHPSSDSINEVSIGLLNKFGVKFKVIDTPEDVLLIGIEYVLSRVKCTPTRISTVHGQSNSAIDLTRIRSYL